MRPEVALEHALVGLRVIVQIKTEYGQRRIYPVCENAKQFCEIAGTITLSMRSVNAIRALGYEVVGIADEP